MSVSECLRGGSEVAGSLRAKIAAGGQGGFGTFLLAKTILLTRVKPSELMGRRCGASASGPGFKNFLSVRGRRGSKATAHHPRALVMISPTITPNASRIQKSSSAVRQSIDVVLTQWRSSRCDAILADHQCDVSFGHAEPRRTG